MRSGAARAAHERMYEVAAGRAPELVITGSNLNYGVVYLAITDQGSCVGPFTGSNAVGVSRSPALLTGCGGATGTISFSAAAQQTNNASLRVCIAGVPATYGVNSSLRLGFFDAGIRYTVTEATALLISRQPGPLTIPWSSEASVRNYSRPRMSGVAFLIHKFVPRSCGVRHGH